MGIEVKFFKATEFEVAMVTNYTEAELLGIFGEFEGRIEGERYFVSTFAKYGDYDNSCEVERGNVRVLEEAEFPAGYTGNGAYGYVYYAIELVPDLMNREQWDELIEIFRGLEEYPCIDEEAMYKVMEEATEEAWGNWLCGEFAGALAEGVCKSEGWECVEVEHKVDLGKALWDLFCELQGIVGIYPIMEAGGNLWVDCKRLVEDASGAGALTLLELAGKGFTFEGEERVD